MTVRAAHHRRAHSACCISVTQLPEHPAYVVPVHKHLAHSRCSSQITHRTKCSGRKKEVIDDEKSDMWRSQQEVLRRRREGKATEGVSERRRKVREEVRDGIFV